MLLPPLTSPAPRPGALEAPSFENSGWGSGELWEVGDARGNYGNGGGASRENPCLVVPGGVRKP